MHLEWGFSDVGVAPVLRVRFLCVSPILHVLREVRGELVRVFVYSHTSARTSHDKYSTLTVWEFRRSRNGQGGQGMDHEPVVVDENTREWETWPEEEVSRKGLVYWRTLISGDVTRSETLTMGIGRVPPGEALRRHRHRPAEVYLVLEGTGSVEIGSEARPVEAGSAVFIPADVFHSLANTGASDLRFTYVFPADSFGEVEYVFDE
jgi:mannose-6-phosphate isomerase-like protein (cupin superfamily)